MKMQHQDCNALSCSPLAMRLQCILRARPHRSLWQSTPLTRYFRPCMTAHKSTLTAQPNVPSAERQAAHGNTSYHCHPHCRPASAAERIRPAWLPNTC